jgi:TfoX/Sxy family transcriptional regulator of competence genes
LLPQNFKLCQKLKGRQQKKEILFEKLVDTNPEIELKGDANKYTSYNGNMFSMLSADQVMAIRLPEKALGEFLKKYNTELKVAYGMVMKEYAVVPDALLKKTSELKKYFDISYEYVKTLKAKATKKARKTESL